MKPLHRLPDAVTFLNLVFGFAAVATLLRWAMDLGGSPQQAAWFILIAAMLDAIDGKLARQLGRQSRFGMELDSLSDAVSFGLAPSVLLYALHFYSWAERGTVMALAGFLIAAMPLLFGCYRLARFNVETEVAGGKKPFFAGLPIPAAAGLIASYILFSYDLVGELYAPPVLPLTLVAAFLMVSRVRFEGMPYFSLRQGNRNLGRLLLLLGVVASILFLQSLALFPAAVFYIVLSLVRHLREDPLADAEAEAEDDLDGTAI
jgi:CDP-diacylglycerol---serine O-phosphatidyltransferase